MASSREAGGRRSASRAVTLGMESKMTRLLIALVAAAMAATAFTAPPASAGVRIGFGFPIGMMMAKPSHGPSYNRGYRRSQAAGSAYKRKKAYAASRASQRAKIAGAQRARAVARANARAEKLAAARAAAARNNAGKGEDKTEAKADTATTSTTSTTTGISEPKPLAPAPVTPPGGPVATTVEPAMVQTTATMSVPDKPAETTAKTSEPEPAKKADCKKFVPSVGLTITVPCN